MQKNITVRIKLEALELAEINSVSATARKYNVDPKQIRELKKQKERLRKYKTLNT